MITAIGTNILFDILLPNKDFFDESAVALQDSADCGSLVLSDIAYAELCAHFEKQRECDLFLESNDIRLQGPTRETLFSASRAWRKYRQQGGKRIRVLSDFLIGAHAQIQATRLLTRDRGFYRSMFPSLDVYDPGLR